MVKNDEYIGFKLPKEKRKRFEYVLKKEGAYKTNFFIKAIDSYIKKFTNKWNVIPDELRLRKKRNVVKNNK